MNTLNLTVLKNLLDDEIFSAFIRAEKGGEGEFCEFLGKLYENGCEENFYDYVEKLVLYDENAFSKCCGHKKAPSGYLKKAYIEDLRKVFETVKRAETDGLFGIDFAPQYPFDKEYDDTYSNLCRFYGENGYGKFIKYKAFIYDNSLIPIENSSQIKLSELKDYENEKKLIESNIVNFLKDLPYSNMLLYGDKGTGKSSTVHAMLNKYAKVGLKSVELCKENLANLPQISQKISEIPLKFILFIDDLSLQESDGLTNDLKTALEGSLTSIPANAMIVATSNRRHIVKENFSERDDAVHASDAMQEQLSLSDRFGLTVMFSSTNKEEYLSIVKQLARDKDLKTNEKDICALAERWALVKGGRSPRRAKQFIDILYSCEVKGEQIDF